MPHWNHSISTVRALVTDIPNDSTYTAFQGTAVHIVSTQLANCHSSILVVVHFNEREAAVGLKSRFDNKTVILEKWYQVILGGVGGEIADVAGTLPLGCLLNHHVIALHAMRREMMMAKRCGWRHAHS